MKILYYLIVLLLFVNGTNAQYAQLNGAPLNSNFNYANTTPTILQGPGVEADVTVQLVMGNATIPANRLRLVFEFSNYQFWDVLNASQIVPPNNFVVANDYVDVATRVIVFTNNVTLTNHTQYYYFIIRGIAKAANPNFTGNVARLEENMLASGQMNFVLSNASISNVLSIGTEPLPLDLGPLIGTKFQENQAQLDWVTYKEEGIFEFNIERSVDGKKWSTIGKLPTISNGSNYTITHQYQYFDLLPLNGSNLYRIKTIDNLKETHYTNVVNLHFPNFNQSIVIYPNPTNEFIFINDHPTASINIINAQGKWMHCKQEFVNGKHMIDVRHLIAGIYFLSITENNETKYISFTKVE